MPTRSSGRATARGASARHSSEAGFVAIQVRTTAHLARAWQRRLPAFGLGLLGDVAAQRFPERRSTIVARARVAPLEE